VLFTINALAASCFGESRVLSKRDTELSTIMNVLRPIQRSFPVAAANFGYRLMHGQSNSSIAKLRPSIVEILGLHQLAVATSLPLRTEN